MKRIFGKKNLTLFVIICGILAGSVVIMCQYLYYGNGKSVNLSEVEVLTQEEYDYFLDALDACATVGDYVYIEGWGLIKDKPIERFDTKLVLYADGLENAKVYNLKMQTRVDVTEMMDNGNNYDTSGFAINIDADLIRGTKFNMALLVEINNKQYLLPMEEVLDV